MKISNRNLRIPSQVSGERKEAMKSDPYYSYAMMMDGWLDG